MQLFLPIALGLALGSGDPESAASMHAFLPRGITSFGAAHRDGWLYILGGYDGQPHAYSREGQRGELLALNLHDPRDLRYLTGIEPLQSVALVAHHTGLIRVGGMRAHNSAKEEAVLRSVAEVARFDVERSEWSALPSLPRSRSSHDAVIAGEQLVVVGGWMLTEDGSEFHADTLVLDLVDPAAGWRSVEAPFRTRALAAASYIHDGQHHVLVIGGLGEDGRMQRSAWSLDLVRGQWTALPDFPVDAFGVAAASLDGGVIASAKDGQVWRFNPGAAEWESVGSLALGRMFHRIVAAGPARALFIGGIGGMDRGDRIRTIELLDLAETALRPSALEVPLPAAPHNRQCAFVDGRTLLLFGGNASKGQHDFAAEAFRDDGLAIDLGSYDARRVTTLPVRRQALEAVVLAETRLALIGGGFGHDGEVARSFAETFLLDLDTMDWRRGPRLDRPRSQFGMAEIDGDVWVFGGHDYDPRRVDDEAFLFPMAVLIADSADLDEGFADSGIRLPRARRAFAHATLDGAVYLIGGMGPDFQAVTTVDVLDTRQGEWLTAATPVTQRVGAACVALDGRLYLLGGTTAAEGDRARPARSIEVYDPKRDEWSVLVSDIGEDLRHVRAAALLGRIAFWTTEGDAHGVLRMRMLAPQPRTVQ